jgi:hypothetical protein
MFDLNKIVTDALTAAVQQAIAPLVEQITALEQRIATLSSQDVAMGGRIDALENIAAEFSPTVQPAVHIDEAKMVEALNSQEWFWEKLHSKISDHVSSRVEEALDDHCSTYDHDDYDNVYNEWGGEDPTEFVRESDIDDKIEGQVNEVLRNATVSISI